LLGFLFLLNERFDDVEEQKDRNKTEELLRESEEKYRILSELSPEMIYLIDLNGCVTYSNRAVLQNLELILQRL